MMFTSLASLLVFTAAAASLPEIRQRQGLLFMGWDRYRVHKTDLDIAGISSLVQISNLTLYAEWAGAAYCNYLAPQGARVMCAGDVCPTVVAHGGTIHSNFAGTVSGVVGFIGLDHVEKAIVVSFRGTNSLRNFANDFTALRTSCNHFLNGCRVHMGFNFAWSEVSAAVKSGLDAARAAYPGYKIVTTGHSLGGAMSILGAAFLRQDGLTLTPYSYGAPRVGNRVFVDYFSRQHGGSGFRVTHLDDPVPRLPPAFFGYRHTSPEFWLRNGTALTNTYKLNEIEMCVGLNNASCNAGQGGFDVAAHGHYLTTIGGCSGSRTFRRDVADSDDDEEVTEVTEVADVAEVEHTADAEDSKPFLNTGPLWYNKWEKMWLTAAWDAIFAIDRRFMRANP